MILKIDFADWHVLRETCDESYMPIFGHALWDMITTWWITCVMDL